MKKINKIEIQNPLKTTKKIKKIIGVNSVKGGCGKTSISLSLALTAATKNEKVCFCDIDVLGTSSKYIVFGKDEKYKIKYIDFKKMEAKADDFINEINFKDHITDIKLNAIFMNESAKYKRNHVKESNLNPMNEIIFIDKLISYLEMIFEKFDVVILDFSPGIDKISSKIHNSIKEYCKKKDHIIYRNVLVATPDYSSIVTMIDTLKEISSEYKITDNRIIINNMLQHLISTEFEKFEKDVFEEYKNEVGKTLINATYFKTFDCVKLFIKSFTFGKTNPIYGNDISELTNSYIYEWVIDKCV